MAAFIVLIVYFPHYCFFLLFLFCVCVFMFIALQSLAIVMWLHSKSTYSWGWSSFNMNGRGKRETQPKCVYLSRDIDLSLKQKLCGRWEIYKQKLCFFNLFLRLGSLYVSSLCCDFFFSPLHSALSVRVGFLSFNLFVRVSVGQTCVNVWTSVGDGH